jgi:hypothetical protein
MRNYDAVRPFEIASTAHQHADDAPLPALKLGAMKVPAMSKAPDLQIEVQETLRRIIVKMPGTAYETRFGLIPRGLCFLSGFGQDDRKLGSLPKSSLSWLRRRQLRKLGNSVGLQTRNADEAGQTGNQQGSGKSPVLTGVWVHLF